MSPRSDIRIDDLAEPALSAEQQAAIDYAETEPIDLSEHGVLEAARQHTGLTDFGADGFRSRLQTWLQAVNEDTELNALGRLGLYSHCVRALSNRLRVEDMIAHHPEILTVEIERPIVVAGLPDSGSRHLVDLLAADTRLRSLPYWESLEPVPAPGDGPGRDGRDPRYERCLRTYEERVTQMPHLQAMDDLPPEHVHEETVLQELDFGTYLLEWPARAPRWRDYYLGLDLRSSYAYLKKVLQLLTWRRGPRRWLLKSSQHLEQLGPLGETFPDATIVLTHRDPVAAIQSTITMLAYADRMRRTRIDLAALAQYWIDRSEKLLRACVRDREALAAERAIDVRFDELVADDLDVATQIYARAGLEMTRAVRAALTTFRSHNPRGKHGKVACDLKADFGLDPAEVRTRFAFYLDRFAVRSEG